MVYIQETAPRPTTFISHLLEMQHRISPADFGKHCYTMLANSWIVCYKKDKKENGPAAIDSGLGVRKAGSCPGSVFKRAR